MKKQTKALTAALLAFCLMLGSFGSITARAEENNGTTENTIIVLDPGHGGSDPGACREFNGITYCERDINLKIATYCKEELAKYSNVTVYMTRTDNDSPLMSRKERAEYAQQVGADVLVSFHINATGAESTTGASGALIYSPNSNYNSSIGAAGAAISIKILQQLTSLGLKDNGVVNWNANENKYPDGSIADYLGINYWCKLKGFPGVLIEHAFVNNPNDVANFLSTDEQLQKLGIADAIGIMECINSGELIYDPNVESIGYWKHNSTGWWFEYPGGGYAANSWEYINGEWYCFNSAGYMVTGWQLLGNNWYYFNGAGAMRTGWQAVNTNWYYMHDSGAMATGWLELEEGWYYLNSSGAMQTGWLRLGNTWYYLNGSGEMATGWQAVNGSWYYLTESGAMATGWQQVDDTWYYLNSSGAMQTGWLRLGSTWYYLTGSGAMATGWQQINGNMYYLTESGAMATGWQELDGTWYYLKSSGEMVTGWQQINGAWYYFDGNGAMAADTWIGSFYVNGSGAWIQ